MPLIRIQSPLKYVITVSIVGTAAFLQWIFWPVIDPAPFLLFYPAVILSALYGDGLSAIWLSVFVVQLFFVGEMYSFHIEWPGDVVRIFLFVLAAYMIRNITRRLSDALVDSQRERAKTQASEAWLGTTLASIGDAVIATDSFGNIAFMNEPAEKLTQWGVQEAKGRPLDEIFHIIHQETRTPVVNPVAEVLKKGVIVGLANHTLLIGKHGKETPVEDSAAPIRSHTAGEIQGVVLVFRDVTEKHAQERRLQELLSELREAVRARDEFMSVASHELKTPITSLKLQFQLAAHQINRGDRRVFLEDSVAKRIETSNRQLDRMTRLIDEMLDSSRIGAGRLEMHTDRLNFSQLVEDVVHRFADQLQMAGSSISTQIIPDVFVKGDEYRLEQVLSNLLTNTIKYGEGKPVVITLNTRHDTAQLTVRDQGIGIDPGSLTRIFDRFERAIPAQKASGLGLGLYISRQIIEAHHGKIWAENGAEQGSAFTVELPLSEQSHMKSN